jgi:hypothetical protein
VGAAAERGPGIAGSDAFLVNRTRRSDRCPTCASLPAAALAALLAATALVPPGGCAAPRPQRATLPDQYRVVRRQLVIYSDFMLAPHHGLIDELIALRGDLSRKLALPGSEEPIEIYLFETPQRYARFMKAAFPQLPDRRAFFIKTGSSLRVYAQWGDRVGEDLRHEVTHGYLHASVPDIPLWLDEGLAEYFEVPRGREGLNLVQLDRLLERLDRDGWQPDLARLEAADPSGDLCQDGYAESWAWVHFLLHADPALRDVLPAYLAELSRGGAVEPVSERLERLAPEAGAALVAHLRRLGRGTPADGPLHEAAQSE